MRRTPGAALLAHPARAVAVAFALAILLGAGLLILPVAARHGSSASPLTALFTSTGAMCGALGVVDTRSYFSGFGQGVVLALIQAGGFGIMSLASLLGLLVSGRF